MSDGPHRSLPMRKPWRRVAEYADMPAFSDEEVSDAVEKAVIHDWKAEVPSGLIGKIGEILGRKQETLFASEPAQSLEALRSSTGGSGLAQLLLDCAIQGSSGVGTEAVALAVERTCSVWSKRHPRQIEEHYLRKSSAKRAVHVRSKIEGAVGRVSFHRLARTLTDGKVHGISLGKKTGLDDGVAF